MEYAEAADILFGLRRFRSDPGTEATVNLLAELDDPQTSYDCIQIAGSNGKGSTARFLARILEAAGYRVGLYTSPHLETLRERVQVNGRKISKHRITEYMESIHDYILDKAADGASPTFFEVVTGLALWQFDQESVDIAVLEVGIGGRYDATSVVDPIASAVTTVTLEHTEVLGDTIPEIARDKATVASDHHPLVTGATGDGLTAIEQAVGSVHRVGPDPEADTVIDYHGQDGLESSIELTGPDWRINTRLSVLGQFQALNAGIATALATQVTDIDAATIASGLRRTTSPGRVEVMTTDPTVILDGAHNPGACAALTDAITAFDYDDLYLVVGAMHDKDLAGMATALPDPTTAYVCRATIDRAADPHVLARVFERADTSTTIEPAVEDALTAALDHATPDDCIVICGSLAVVAEARRRWTRVAIPHQQPHHTPLAALTASDIPTTNQQQATATLRHQSVRLTAQTARAHAIQSEATSAGVTAIVSPLIGVDREPIPIILTGSHTAFNQLIDRLNDRGNGLAPYANTIQSALQPTDSPSVVSDTTGTAVMGIVNVTPDSFHDGGEYNSQDDAITHATELVAAGADIIDIGGESTRPGADPVPVAEERDRVLPVVEAVTDLDAVVSVDTRRASVARPALAAGADIINDVSGLADPEMRFAVADHDASIVVMHSLATPVDPTQSTIYDDVVTDVITDLIDPVTRARQVGLSTDQIIIDPGLGFGKSAAESFELLHRLPELTALGCPVMIGHSHKSMFGAAGFDADNRTNPTIAATALAAERGADIVRVHDVAANAAAVDTVATTLANTDGDRDD